MTLLDIRGLNVYYGESHILRDVDLNVAAGEMVCLIGRNGVGKTTLLKTVIGLLQQRSGDLQLEGRELTGRPPHARARVGVGYVPQGREIIPQLTVRENLLLGLEALPGGLAKNRHIDPLVFELFPILEKFLARRGGDLSGGQQLAQQANAILERHGLPALSFWAFDRPTAELKQALPDAFEQFLRLPDSIIDGSTRPQRRQDGSGGHVGGAVGDVFPR